jgi:hypothetical protein
MHLTSDDREQLRLSLLRFLEANNSRFGLPTDFLLQRARAEGRPMLLREQIETELDYLTDKTLVDEVLKSISPERRSWRITAAGRDHFAQTCE